VPALQTLARSSNNLLARFHATWTLEGLGALDAGLVRDLMKDANSPLGNIVSAGRAFGYTLWACSQVGHADTIGRVREQGGT